MTQAVIFPQAEQPGKAQLKEVKGEYTLSNELFTAKFISQNRKLVFAGSPELGLLPDTEIFKIRLGDGTEVPASAMELEEVRTLNLKGDKNAVKGAKRFNGQAIEAEFAKIAEGYGVEVDKVKAVIPASEVAKDVAVGMAIDFVKANGYFDVKRNEQSKFWMYESINERLKTDFYRNPEIAALLAKLETEVLSSKKSSFIAAKEALDKYYLR